MKYIHAHFDGRLTDELEDHAANSIDFLRVNLLRREVVEKSSKCRISFRPDAVPPLQRRFFNRTFFTRRSPVHRPSANGFSCHFAHGIFTHRLPLLFVVWGHWLS